MTEIEYLLYTNGKGVPEDCMAIKTLKELAENGWSYQMKIGSKIIEYLKNGKLKSREQFKEEYLEITNRLIDEL